jgi:hypothetical protein
MQAALSGASVAPQNAVFLYVGVLQIREAGNDNATPSGGRAVHGPITTSEFSTCTLPIRWSETDFIVTINLCNLAVYLIYIAWHDNR